MSEEDKILEKELQKIKDEDILDGNEDLEDLIRANQMEMLEGLDIDDLGSLQELDSWKDLVSSRDLLEHESYGDVILAESISSELKSESINNFTSECSIDLNDSLEQSMEWNSSVEPLRSSPDLSTKKSPALSHQTKENSFKEKRTPMLLKKASIGGLLDPAHLKAQLKEKIADENLKAHQSEKKSGHGIEDTNSHQKEIKYRHGTEENLKAQLKEKLAEQIGAEERKASLLSSQIASQLPDGEQLEIIVPEPKPEKEKGHVYKGKIPKEIQKEKGFQEKLKLLGIKLRVNVDLKLPENMKPPVLKRVFSFSELEVTKPKKNLGKEEEDELDDQVEGLPTKNSHEMLSFLRPRNRLFENVLMDRKRSVSTNKIALFESKPMYIIPTEKEKDEPEAIIAKNIKDMDQSTLIDAKILGAITRKLTLELDVMMDKKKRQKEFNNNKAFQLESLKISKKAKLRHLRDSRNVLPQLHQKKKQLTHYIIEDSKAMFTKEKTRNSVLLAAAASFMNKMNKVIQQRNEAKDDVLHAKEEVLQLHRHAKSKYDDVKVQYNKLKDDLRFLNSEYEKLAEEMEQKRADKMALVQRNVLLDSEVQIKDIEILMRALNKRQTMGFQIASIKELDVIDLADCNLNRLPLMQLNTEVVRHVNVSKNQLKTLEQLDMFTELESLVTDNNTLSEINLKELSNLKVFSVASNQLTTLSGLSKKLHYLNAGANKFTSLAGIDSAPDLRILILNNSTVRDLSSLRFLTKLVYLDMSASSLSETAMDELYGCICLQYLDASNNLLRSIPEIPTQALYELHLNANMIAQLSRTSWLFNLRILSMSDNQLIDIVPLAMCPFLVELNLSNNLLREVKCLYGISICQSLEKLEMSGNAVSEDPKFHITIGTLFPKIKFVNGQEVNMKEPESLRKYGVIHPLSAVKLCEETQQHIMMFLEDPTDAEYKIEVFNIWHKLSSKLEKALTDYLGKYYSPYLRYVCSGSELVKFDPTTNVHVQERRLFWLTEAVLEILREIEITPQVTWDGSLLKYCRELDFKIMWHRVVYIQSVWRAKSARKVYLRSKQMIINIQKSFRNYIACRNFKDILRRLKRQKLEHDSAIIIQKVWRASRVRTEFKQRLQEKREADLLEQKRRDEELARQLKELENEENRKLDQWLEGNEEDKFDRLMRKYLENEKLLHYPNNPNSKFKSSRHKALELLQNGMDLRDMYDEEPVTAKAAETDEGTDEDDEPVGRSHGYYLGDGINPPLKPINSLKKTLELAKERHKIMANITKQYNNLPQMPYQGPEGHVSLKAVLMTKAGDMVPDSPQGESSKVIALPKPHLITSQDIEGLKQSHSRATSNNYDRSHDAQRNIQYGTTRPSYFDYEDRPPTRYLLQEEYIGRTSDDSSVNEYTSGLDYIPSLRLECRLSYIDPDKMSNRSRIPSVSVGDGSVKGHPHRHKKINQTHSKTGMNPENPLTTLDGLKLGTQQFDLPELSEEPENVEMHTDPSGYSDSVSRKHSVYSTGSMDSTEKMEAFQEFYKSYKIEPSADVSELSGTNSVNNEELGWNQYSQNTIQLLKLKQKRLNKLNPKAKKNIGPINRYSMVKDRTKVEPISRRESIESFKEILKSKQKRSAVPVVFEWDIHPGEVSRKFVPKKMPIEFTQPEAIPFVGNFSKPTTNNLSTNPVPQPPVTLLINNYVKKHPENVIDPRLIHRLPPPKPRPQGPLATMLDLIPSKIKVPDYGGYELPKQRVLPSIQK